MSRQPYYTGFRSVQDLEMGAARLPEKGSLAEKHKRCYSYATKCSLQVLTEVPKKEP